MPENGRRSLRATILEVMGSGPGPWTRESLLTALDARDAAPLGKNPRNTLGNRLLEMVERGELERAGRGQYRLPNGRNKNQPLTLETA